MKLLLLIVPIALFANSYTTAYGDLGLEVKAEYKSYSKELDAQKKQTSSYLGAEFSYSKDFFQNWNFSASLLANIPVSNDPEEAGGNFRFGEAVVAGNDAQTELILAQTSLEYAAENFSLQTFRHQIDTPLAKSEKEELLPTLFEGATVSYDLTQVYTLKLGIYSRIFGYGNNLAEKRGEFVTLTESLNKNQNVSDNYLGVAGLELENQEAGYAGKLYYYNLLEHDVGTQSNSLSIMYLDALYVKKIVNHYKVRKKNNIVSRSDTDTLVFLGQLYQATQSLRNDFLVLGLKGIYRNSTSPFGYMLSYTTVGGESGGVRYPFGTVPEYTKTADFDLSKLGSADMGYKLEAKRFWGRDFVSLYYAGFDGEDIGTIQSASIYGIGFEREFFQVLKIAGSLENQVFKGVGTASLEDNLASNFKIRYSY